MKVYHIVVRQRYNSWNAKVRRWPGMEPTTDREAAEERARVSDSMDSENDYEVVGEHVWPMDTNGNMVLTGVIEVQRGHDIAGWKWVFIEEHTGLELDVDSDTRMSPNPAADSGRMCRGTLVPPRTFWFEKFL